MSMSHMFLSVAAVLAGATSSPQSSPHASEPVMVVVEVPIPHGMPRERIVEGMRQTIPQYRSVPGLVRKSFTVADKNFGGIYLFADRASADAWFNDAWRVRIRTTYGADANVTYYSTPIILDNSPPPAPFLAK